MFIHIVYILILSFIQKAVSARLNLYKINRINNLLGTPQLYPLAVLPDKRADENF